MRLILALLFSVLSVGWFPKGCDQRNGDCIGGFYAGFQRSFFDDFNSLDAVGPINPNGKYFMTRGYGNSSTRVFASPGDSFSETDPAYTGYADANRGVPFGYTNVRVSGGVLTLQTRRGTSAESNTFPAPSTQLNVTGILSSEGAIGFYVGASCKIMVEGRMQFALRNMTGAGWLAAFWITSENPVKINDADEFDIFENSVFTTDDEIASFNYNQFVGGTNVASAVVGSWGAYDSSFHTYTIKLDTAGTQTVYQDHVQKFTKSVNPNLSSAPQYFLLDSRIKVGGLVQSAWTADGTTSTSGSAINADWVSIWRQDGCPHFVPQMNLPDTKLAYNGTGSVVLPSAVALWADGTVTEYVQCRPFEPTEPGGALGSNFSQFPSYYSYNAGTRTLSIDFSAATGNAGISHCIVSAYKSTGATFIPARFNIYRGPNISTASTINGTHGVAFSHDFYPECDVGIATIDPTTGPPYKIAITGLPSGLSLDTDGVVSGTPASAGDTIVPLTCMNNVGQTSLKSITLHIT